MTCMPIASQFSLEAILESERVLGKGELLLD
jgi:hypothetical protein